MLVGETMRVEGTTRVVGMMAEEMREGTMEALRTRTRARTREETRVPMVVMVMEEIV